MTDDFAPEPASETELESDHPEPANEPEESDFPEADSPLDDAELDAVLEALLLVVDRERWDITLPDLRSRMGAALQLRIGPPDDALAADLMLSHAAQRGLALGEGAPAYLVPRMERSYAAIEKIVAEIDRLSLERQVPATLSIWRDALEAVQGPDQGRLL